MAFGSSVFVAELPWPAYARKVQGGKCPLFLPLGALEQHGHHMSMNVDVLLPCAFSRIVAERTGGLVAQPFLYGAKSMVKSGGGNFWAGTTSLDGATLTAMLKDILKEYARHGLRNFVLVNGHFENSPFIAEGVDLALRELAWQQTHDVKVVVLSYWDFVTEATIEKIYPEGFLGWDIEHAGVLETSLMLRLHPELVDLEAAEDVAPARFPAYDVYPQPQEWVPKSGTLSSPKHATREKGDLLLKVCTEGITAALDKEF